MAPAAVAALDVDGDGASELWHVVSDWDPLTETFTTTFTVRTFDGDTATVVDTFDRAGDHRGFADIDGDGRSDALLETTPGVGWSFLAGRPGGDFTTTAVPLDVPVGYDWRLLDVDGDEAVDVVQMHGLEGVLEVALGDGAGGFTVTGQLAVADASGLDVRVADGHLVITASPFCDFCTPDTEVVVAAVLADGSLQERARSRPGGVVPVLDAFERNGDGEPVT